MSVGFSLSFRELPRMWNGSSCPPSWTNQSAFEGRLQNLMQEVCLVRFDPKESIACAQAHALLHSMKKSSNKSYVFQMIRQFFYAVKECFRRSEGGQSAASSALTMQTGEHSLPFVVSYPIILVNSCRYLAKKIIAPINAFI
jgi:hypothetical protein